MAFPPGMKGNRVMVFVDGENLAARYGAFVKAGTPGRDVAYGAGLFAWTSSLMRFGNPTVPVVRHYYYTSAVGSQEILDRVHDQLRELRIEEPRVFRKQKGKQSKRVDISLSVDMLAHAHRGNCDVAVLVTGDEDYVPLVEAVKREGCRVVLWFFGNGLSVALRRSADHYFNLEHAFLLPGTAGLEFRNATYL